MTAAKATQTQFTRMTRAEVKAFKGLTIEGQFSVVAPRPPAQPPKDRQHGTYIYIPNGNGDVDITNIDPPKPSLDMRC
ncbi:MAG: hypothetical protein GW778_05490 [Alphaproteobacteria bacterium]|nr:hypothetical protein [Alphaproteobacteria bacterium]